MVAYQRQDKQNHNHWAPKPLHSANIVATASPRPQRTSAPVYRWFVWLLTAILALLVSGCGSSDDELNATALPPAQTITPSAGNTVDATTMVALINAKRSREGLAPLTWAPLLETAALRHINDMSDNGHFSHTGTDGSSVGQRVTDSGYTWRSVGENIAVG